MKVSARLTDLEPDLGVRTQIERLKAKLGDVAQGRAFLLQGGDCAGAPTSEMGSDPSQRHNVR